MLHVADPIRLENSKLILELKALVRTERKVTAEILTYIKEVDRRRLYLTYDCTSLFTFLVKELGYTKAAAQRRVDSARLLNELPEIKKDLQDGSLNLSQVSLLAQCVRQKERESDKINIGSTEKRKLVALVKHKDLEQSQLALTQHLDIEVKSVEKKRMQKDESVRWEITLNKEQTELVNRVKELVSHIHPNPSISDLLTILAKDYVKRKDPLAKVLARPGEVKSKSAMRETHITHKNEISEKRQSNKTCRSKIAGSITELTRRKPISVQVRRDVFRRDNSCQWQNPTTGHICGSRFQLEIDHIHPVWSGGSNELENLRVLCRRHNHLKYENEITAWEQHGELREN